LLNARPSTVRCHAKLAVLRSLLLIELPLPLPVLELLPHFNLLLAQKFIHELFGVHALRKNRYPGRYKNDCRQR
jgi:hypothetical protein